MDVVNSSDVAAHNTGNDRKLEAYLKVRKCHSCFADAHVE